MPEPTESARAIRLEAITRRAADERNTSSAALDRRWLLGEIGRLTTERDGARELLAAVTADYERDVTP